VTLRDEQLMVRGRRHVGAALEEADHRLTAGPKLGPRERLDVYRRGYEARLVECLADDYPVLKVALGDDAFDALCRAYVARFPSEAPNLNAYGRHMAEDVRRLRGGPGTAGVGHRGGDPRAVRAPDDDGEPGRGARGRLGGAHLVASPALRLLTLEHPANDYFQAVRDGHAPSIPAREPSATVVYRSGPTVWRMGLTPPMHRVLAALVGGEPLEAALSLAEGEPEEQVTAWFREWVSSGLFVASRRAEAAPSTGMPPPSPEGRCT
jgi:hypothetical protein